MTYDTTLKKFSYYMHHDLRLITFQLINILYTVVVLCHILTGYLKGGQNNKNCFFR